MSLRISHDRDSLTLQPQAWPRELDVLLSSLDAAQPAKSDRRSSARLRHRVVANLHVHGPGGVDPVTVYTRDADPRGIGFVTRECLPLGYNAHLDVVDANGQPLHAACTIYRCRTVAPGWFEGALLFDRPQSGFRVYTSDFGS